CVSSALSSMLFLRMCALSSSLSFFFFPGCADPGDLHLSLHDALPIWRGGHARALRPPGSRAPSRGQRFPLRHAARQFDWLHETLDRKSTRLNSSHGSISYAVFCLKKKKQILPFTSTHSISTQRNKTQE